MLTFKRVAVAILIVVIAIAILPSGEETTKQNFFRPNFKNLFRKATQKAAGVKTYRIEGDDQSVTCTPEGEDTLMCESSGWDKEMKIRKHNGVLKSGKYTGIKDTRTFTIELQPNMDIKVVGHSAPWHVQVMKFVDSSENLWVLKRRWMGSDVFSVHSDAWKHPNALEVTRLKVKDFWSLYYRGEENTNVLNDLATGLLTGIAGKGDMEKQIEWQPFSKKEKYRQMTGTELSNWRLVGFAYTFPNFGKEYPIDCVPEGTEVRCAGSGYSPGTAYSDEWLEFTIKGDSLTYHRSPALSGKETTKGDIHWVVRDVWGNPLKENSRRITWVNMNPPEELPPTASATYSELPSTKNCARKSDLRSFTGTVEDCKTQCSSDPACKGFDRGFNTCYLKTDCSAATQYEKRGFESYQKDIRRH
jgi:hypothetical protein